MSHQEFDRICFTFISNRTGVTYEEIVGKYMTHNLSQRYEQAQISLAAIEDEVANLLISIGLSLDKWSAFYYDPYDDELLITGCDGLTEEQKQKLIECGFKPRTMR